MADRMGSTTKRNKIMDKKILNVGSGSGPSSPGVLRLDSRPEVKPDLLWDLNKTPLPLAADSFDEIECSDVLEHLADIPSAMEEFHRLLKNGGRLKITTPHFSCSNSYRDPTHKFHLSYFSLDYFTSEHSLAYYSRARFKIRHRKIVFQGGFLRRLMNFFAGKFPEIYENRLCWLVPAWFIYFELESVK